MSNRGESRVFWRVDPVVRKKRSRFGVLFFLELAFFVIMTSVCFIGFSFLAENEITGAAAALILAAAILLSPFAKRLIRGLMTPFRQDSENWDHYFND